MKIDWLAVLIALVICFGIFLIYQMGKWDGQNDCERSIVSTDFDPYG